MEEKEVQNKANEESKPESATSQSNVESQKEIAEAGNSDNERNKKKNIWFTFERRISADTLINLFLSIATFFLIWQAISQSESARKAVKIAEENYDLAKEISDQAAIESNKRFKLDSISSNAQVQALKDAVDEMKRQFDVENESFISIQPTDFFFDDKNRMTIKFETVNEGRTQVRITKWKLMAAWLPNQPEFSRVNEAEWKEEPISLIKEYPQPSSITINRTLSNIEVEDINNKRLNVYFLGQVAYTNPLTRKWHTYSFLFQFDLPKNSSGLNYRVLKGLNE